VQWREPLRAAGGEPAVRSAFWGSDLVATIGDRVHRVASGGAGLRADWFYDGRRARLPRFSGLPDLVLGPARWRRRRSGRPPAHHDRSPISLAFCRCVLLPIAADSTGSAVIYVLLFLINAAAILHRPAKMAAIPAVVPSGQLTDGQFSVVARREPG
jgi:hypothetical protein